MAKIIRTISMKNANFQLNEINPGSIPYKLKFGCVFKEIALYNYAPMTKPNFYTTKSYYKVGHYTWLHALNFY